MKKRSVGATIYCVKLQMGLSQLEQDFKDYKREMKMTVKDFDNRGDDLDKRLTHMEDWREIQWPTHGGVTSNVRNAEH
jgi:hypothetical protein